MEIRPMGAAPIDEANRSFSHLKLQAYNFACCFVWVWNLVVDIAGRKEAEGVWEHGVEENIWT